MIHIKLPTMNEDLAYVLGVYLGDGSITSNGRAFTLQVIDKDFAERVRDTLNRILPVCHVDFRERNRKTNTGNTVYAVTISNVEFCRYLKEYTGYEKHLPSDFDKWEERVQKALIVGLLDSEGSVGIGRDHVRFDGQRVCCFIVSVGSADPWSEELHAFLMNNGYKVGKIIRETMKSGRINSKFQFNKKSFIEKGLYFTIARTQARIEEYKKMFPGSTTKRHLPISEETRNKQAEVRRDFWRRKREKGKGNDIV